MCSKTGFLFMLCWLVHAGRQPCLFLKRTILWLLSDPVKAHLRGDKIVLPAMGEQDRGGGLACLEADDLVDDAEQDAQVGDGGCRGAGAGISQLQVRTLLGAVEFKHFLPLQILQPGGSNRSPAQVPSFGYSGPQIWKNTVCSGLITSRIQPVNLFQRDSFRPCRSSG